MYFPVSTLPQIENIVLILIFAQQKPIDRIGFTLTELPVSIITITILVAIYLYKRGFISIDKIKALYNKIKAFLNKTKKSTKNGLTKINANLDIYIPETV